MDAYWNMYMGLHVMWLLFSGLSSTCLVFTGGSFEGRGKATILC